MSGGEINTSGGRKLLLIRHAQANPDGTPNKVEFEFYRRLFDFLGSRRSSFLFMQSLD